jgi:hypothetical protein
MTKERPILFSGEMVRAILAGNKTQTRRIMKPQPAHYCDSELCWSWGGYSWNSEIHRPENRIDWRGEDGLPFFEGMRLWVKETFRPCFDDGSGTAYRADRMEGTPERGGKWKPSIFMPRNRSRITLEIVSVRVERLNDISEQDAKAEGCEPSEKVEMKDGSPCYSLPYRILWEHINGVGSWEKNPWVWVISFKPLEPSGKPLTTPSPESPDCGGSHRQSPTPPAARD